MAATALAHQHRQYSIDVQRMCARRFDPEKRLPTFWLLQTAAVIGPEVPVPLLQAIAKPPEDALQWCLAHLLTTVQGNLDQAIPVLEGALALAQEVYLALHVGPCAPGGLWVTIWHARFCSMPTPGRESSRHIQLPL